MTQRKTQSQVEEESMLEENRPEVLRMEIESLSRNEEFARVVVSVFMARMNPTLEELDDVKTAVSEAVTNAVIHGYQGNGGIIYLEVKILGQELTVTVKDTGYRKFPTSRRRWNRCSPPTRRERGPAWDSPSWRRLWMSFRWNRRLAVELQLHMKKGSSGGNYGSYSCPHRACTPGDKAARDLLFEENTGLIYSVAKRFLGRGVEMEDLFQIGSIGLLKAVDKFDMSYDVKFSTYAVPMIIGEIKRYLRDDGILKVSRSLKENHYRIYQVREALTRRLEREPTTGEMAEEMGISIEELVMTMESGAEVESLHKTIYQGEGTEISLMDKLPEKKTGRKSTGQDFSGRDTGDSGGKGAEVDLYAVFSEHDPDGDRP